jgi:hypothetical protein
MVQRPILGGKISTYWMYDWLDQNEIQAPWEIDNALSERRGFETLVEMYEQASAAKAPSELITPQKSILAGRSLDLSGKLACGDFRCLQKEIESGFFKIWHYFDGIVAAGINPVIIYDAARDDDPGDLARNYTLSHLRLLLYIRSIGAEPWVTFVNKDRQLSEDEWWSLARSLKIADAFKGQRHNQIVDMIAKDMRLDVEHISGNMWQIKVSGGYFTNGKTEYFDCATRPTINIVIHTLLRDYGDAAIEDVLTAQELALPLVQPATVPWINSTKPSKNTPTHEQVALQLRLPVFSNLNVSDFLKLREDERPAFENFRKGLRDQIQSQLGSAVRGETATNIARDVEDDYIRPGLAEIEQRIRGSRKALIKKSGLSFGIGTSVATIGAVSSVPMMIAGSVIALGSTVPLAPLIGSYIDEVNKEIPMHKLYFLWRLKKKGLHW